MNTFPSLELALCIAGCSLATALPRVLPMMYLKPDTLPRAIRDWLSFIPVTVMAALLGADIFFYQGRFLPTTDNLFLMVAIPSLILAKVSGSFFGTIAFAMTAVALARYLGLYA